METARAIHTLSPAMQAVFDRAVVAAATDSNILILGEAYVGKEVLGRRIHERSARAAKPIAYLNLIAQPPTVVERELFGLAPRALAQSSESRAGLFEAGRGGTVLLDEIGYADAAVRATVLMAMKTRHVYRIGSDTPTPTDVRVIATSQNFPGAAQAELAADLEKCRPYFDVKLEIPPLRERRSEIPELARLFVAAMAQDDSPPPIRAAAMAILESQSWPGNIQELKNVMERAVVLSEGRAIGPELLPESFRAAGATE